MDGEHPEGGGKHAHDFPEPEPCVATALDSIADEGIGLWCITVWEVLDGIGRLIPGRRRVGLSTRFLDLLDELFEDRLVG